MAGLADALMQPGGLDPELLQQLLSLGSVDQRHKLLQEQLGRADATAAGSPVDFRRGKGTPQLLAGLANLVSAGVGGWQGGKAMAGEQSLIDQTGAARSAFGDALSRASQPVQAPPDMLAAPGYDAATQEKGRQGLLSSLRSMGLLSGDPAIKSMVEGGPRMALEDQQVAAGQRAAEAATSPATGKAFQILGRRFGTEIPEGTPNAAAEKITNIAEKGYSAEQQRLSRADAAKVAADARRDVALTNKEAKQTPKQIPARQAERYAQLKATIQALDPYMTELGAAVTGPIAGRLNAVNPYKGAATAKAIATEGALKIKLARALHGGVPTKTEIEEAGKYIPGVTDTDEQRSAKMDALQSLFRDEEQTLKDTYGQVGLNTSKLTTAPPSADTSDLRKKYGL